MTAYRVPPHVSADMRAKRRAPEYAEQSSVVSLYQSIGASVYVNSVYGAHPKGVTPGIPDMRVKQPDWRLEWDHETKPAGKRQSVTQYRYLNECMAMGTVYVLGGLSESIDFLIFLGIGKRIGSRDSGGGTIQLYPRDWWVRNVAAVHLPLRDWPMTTDPREPQIGAAWYASEAFARQLATFGYKPSAK